MIRNAKLSTTNFNLIDRRELTWLFISEVEKGGSGCLKYEEDDVDIEGRRNKD